MCIPANAAQYTLSSSTLDITTPGSDTISGSGSGSLFISNTVDDAVYYITLNNMTLDAASWASAITINNSSSTTVTVYFIIEGTNYTR